MSQNLNSDIRNNIITEEKLKSQDLDEVLEKLKKIKGYNFFNFSKEQENFLKALPKKYIEVLYKKMSKQDAKNILLDSDAESDSIENNSMQEGENENESGDEDLSQNRKNSKNNEIHSNLHNLSNFSINPQNREIVSENNFKRQTFLNQFLVQMSNSKKPLWIEDVKKTCDKFIPQVDMKDLENTKDILIKEEQEEIFLNFEDYPYFHTVKKLLYAFGDVYKNSSRTVLYFHDFLKRFLILLTKIINECEFKKVLEHLYSYEFHKFFNYKKLKFKNNYAEGIDDECNMINNSPIEVEMEDNIAVNTTPQIHKKKGSNLNQTYSAFELGDAMQIEELAEITQFDKENFEFLNETNNGRRVGTDKNYLENIFEEKDENYFENLEFQDQRTSTMNHSEYLEFISCRHQTFLTKGKKSFLNFLQNILQNNFAFELRDSNNLELISFLMKEILRKIVTNAIKNKFPGTEKKLFILNFPLTVEDVEEICNKELEKLESFLSDFYTDIYLIKEFKKKKFSKKNNKNVKIKRNSDEFVIIIKKLIYLDDESQIEFLRKEKKNSEEKILNYQKEISEKFSEIKKKLKMKFENAEIKSKNLNQMNNSITRANTKKIQNNKNSKISANEDNILFDMKSELNLTNFYEYFLIKDYLIENLPGRVSELLQDNNPNNYKLLIDEINKKSNLLKKLNRKTISNRFSQWLKLTSNERNYLIEEFQNKNLVVNNSQNEINKITQNKNSLLTNSNKRNDENSENFSSGSE